MSTGQHPRVGLHSVEHGREQVLRRSPLNAGPGHGCDVVRLPWQASEQRLQSSPRQPRRAQIEQVDVVPAEKVGFDCLPVLGENGEEADYFPSEVPLASSMIAPSIAWPPPAFLNLA